MPYARAISFSLISRGPQTEIQSFISINLCTYVRKVSYIFFKLLRFASKISFTSVVHSYSSLNFCHGSGVKFTLMKSSISTFVASEIVFIFLVSQNLILARRTMISKNSNLFNLSVGTSIPFRFYDSIYKVAAI